MHDLILICNRCKCKFFMMDAPEKRQSCYPGNVLICPCCNDSNISEYDISEDEDIEELIEECTRYESSDHEL